MTFDGDAWGGVVSCRYLEAASSFHRRQFSSVMCGVTSLEGRWRFSSLESTKDTRKCGLAQVATRQLYVTVDFAVVEKETQPAPAILHSLVITKQQRGFHNLASSRGPPPFLCPEPRCRWHWKWPVDEQLVANLATFASVIAAREVSLHLNSAACELYHFQKVKQPKLPWLEICGGEQGNGKQLI